MGFGQLDSPRRSFTAAPASAEAAVYPQVFSGVGQAGGRNAYLRAPLIRRLVDFFESKGLSALKAEDRREQWYDDWLAVQAQDRSYAQLLSPQQFSRLGATFDLLRLARFLEVCAYFSPAHGYSLQVTFLGLFAILMGDNGALKREAVTTLEAGGLLAFGVSERRHGSDLLSNEFMVREIDAGRFVANGAKYYIGNANAAAMISILARKEDPRGAAYARRAPLVLLALRPDRAVGFRRVGKIATLGVRAAYVGEFEVKDHEFPPADLIAEGRRAWDAVLGTVTLGKFFLGFGSVGICEHAFAEAAAHLSARTLYGRPGIEMPHLRRTMTQAWARLTGMKLYAYRALDYVHAAGAADRRYLLYCAVQKAKVSTEGVKVVALLSECIGARGFEAETYFEMALRDAPLIPGLEGSAHINLRLAVQFIPRYFGQPDPGLALPPSVLAGEVPSAENPYLMAAAMGAVNSIAFPHFLTAYEPLIAVPNVRIFVKQAKAFQLFIRGCAPQRLFAGDTPEAQALGQCLAVTVYAQLIAENATRLSVPREIVSAIFHTLVMDFSTAALALAACADPPGISPFVLRRMVSVPHTSIADWDYVARQMTPVESAGPVRPPPLNPESPAPSAADRRSE
jgi:acyl-CoA dehydrogenase